MLHMQKSRAQVLELVAQGNVGKCRFQLCEGDHVRAFQGHSAAVFSGHGHLRSVIRLEDIHGAEAMHATSEAAWLLIQQSGELRPMARQHCHFALEVHMMRDQPVRLRLDVAAAIRECRLFLADNDVLLCDGVVPIRLLERMD